MPGGDADNSFRIGTWLVQPDLNRLSDGDQVVTLELRVMAVLVCLARQPGKIVRVDELLDTVWHGRAHADDTIYQAVAHLRKSLGDDVHDPRYIETIAKKGYRLICPVTPAVADFETSEIALDSPIGQRHRRRTLAIFAGVVSIVVAIVLTINMELWDWLSPTDDGPSDRSVAVLPFIDMSEDGSQQYLGDGISEELIHVLSNVPDLRVIARTSSFAFRDSNEDIRQIGKQLNVATILEGSVRKDGDRIRITSQLVDTSNGYHLWSQTFERHTSDLFRIQKEIAIAVGMTFENYELDALAIDDQPARPDELLTYDHYLLGLHHLRMGTRSSYLLAIQHFQSAIEMDPSFARAYAGLSSSYASRFFWEWDQELIDKAESAAEYALLLDDQSAEAYVALGHTKITKRDFAGAETALIRALELNPNDERAYYWLRWAYRGQGRKEEAFAVLQEVLELNPMSGELNMAMGYYLQELRSADLDTIFMYWKRAMEREPDYSGSYGAFGQHYRTTGQLDLAIPYFNKVIELTSGPTQIGWADGLLAEIYIDLGDYESAAQVIRRMSEIEPDNTFPAMMEIHLQFARGEFSAVRDNVHRMQAAHIDEDTGIGWIAFYEMVIGDTKHAEELYARQAAEQEPSIVLGQKNLYRRGELLFGMMGAVNLAYLHKRNGQHQAVEELLRKAREFIESDRWYPHHGGTIPYVYAQIAVIEGNNDAAIDYFREAVDVGWTRAWFVRIDPIMTQLREDARFMRILGDLETKLLEMRENLETLASTESQNNG